jgi:hypothetical protein
MFKNLEQKLKNLAGGHQEFDASCFNDPIAMQTEWAPVQTTGVPGDKLIKVRQDRMEVRASLKTKLAFLLFVIIGLGVIIGVVSYKFSAGSLAFDKNTIMPMVIGLIFSVAGGVALYLSSAPVVLDKQIGFVWKGRRSPNSLADAEAIKICAKLEDIHALQLISEYCTGSKGGAYHLYHINLVLADGKRIKVLTQGNRTQIRSDASVLSAFLNKPLWDAI